MRDILTSYIVDVDEPRPVFMLQSEFQRAQQITYPTGPIPLGCRRKIPAAAGAADATPSGVSRVRVTRTVLRECDIGLHRTVKVDSHRRRTDTRIRGRCSPL